VRVTVVPLLKLALQVEGQLMPEGLLVTVPLPDPARVTVTVKDDGGGVVTLLCAEPPPQAVQRLTKARTRALPAKRDISPIPAGSVLASLVLQLSDLIPRTIFLFFLPPIVHAGTKSALVCLNAETTLLAVYYPTRKSEISCRSGGRTPSRAPSLSAKAHPYADKLAPIVE
jgi:hypothetical protein